MTNYVLFILFIISIQLSGCTETSSQSADPLVKLGSEVLLDRYVEELRGKRIGLLMNPASRVDGVHMLDTLISLDLDIRALFAAEHGFRGQAGAGEKIRDGIDSASGLPVYSLYQGNRKPTEAMLGEVDLILFDLPDVGARFFTYSSTMGKVIEALSETDKELWILDRPNPAGGDYISGFSLRQEYQSFVGAYPMPAVYGLSIGEIAKMAVGESWLELAGDPEIRVIKTEGWNRYMKWQDTGLNWFSPSPNLPSYKHAYVYLGTVLFEGTNVSEGRGTQDPFLQIGSPDLDFEEYELEELAEKHGLNLRKGSFTPVSIPGKALSPKFEGEECTAIIIDPESVDPHKLDPVAFGYDLLLFVKGHTRNFEVLPFINNLSGIGLKEILENNGELPEWAEEVSAFRDTRRPYLIY
ncbi:exo-beta-N-acetylmuramidase NamZ domain-containing protein [Balneola sp. MJW-20]|uniref:exo-beta-N-acetylmuramidase NamZ family protein n=1 Tax=Gracilimonas aurantiaca TaxID=3234185 RepID=UPI0034656E54